MSDENAGKTHGARPPVVMLLIDDHALFRGTLERYLRESSEDELRVVNTTATPEALSVATAVQPEIVLVELGQPLSKALELIGKLRERVPGAGIIALRWGDSQLEEAQALAAGADRCLTKRTLDTALIDTIAALRAQYRNGHLPSA